jgi:mono/diheme cytochrome c family protein
VSSTLRDRIKKIASVWLAALLSTYASGTHSTYPPAGQCPQPRFTGKAPDAIYNLRNPLDHDPSSIAAGRRIYEKQADPPCRMCHGVKGDGQGPLAKQFDPPPRNFSCAETVTGIPDGQLFWIIQNGSPGTAMPSFHTLPDAEIWQVVSYLRELAK